MPLLLLIQKTNSSLQSLVQPLHFALLGGGLLRGQQYNVNGHVQLIMESSLDFVDTLLPFSELTALHEINV